MQRDASRKDPDLRKHEKPGRNAITRARTAMYIFLALLLLVDAAAALRASPRVVRSSSIVCASSAFPLNEFSRPIAVDSLGKKAVRSDISATPEECAALAKRFALTSLDSVSAKVSCTLIDPRKSRVRAWGTFSAANVAQMESVPIAVDEVPFETFYSDDAALASGKNAYDSESEEDYDEPIEEGQIDLGELVAQHLYLHISQPEVDFGDEDEEFAPGEVVFDTGGGGSIDV